MHAGKLESSQRLKDTYAVLSDRDWHSTRDIGRLTGSCAVHSDIAALRENGMDVVKRQRRHMGIPVYEYIIVGKI